MVVSGRNDARGREAAGEAGEVDVLVNIAGYARPVTGTVLAVDAGRAAAL